jgi:hypothetical protein
MFLCGLNTAVLKNAMWYPSCDTFPFKPMYLKYFTQFEQLAKGTQYEQVQYFINQHPQGNYFQSLPFFQLIEGLDEFSPQLFIASDQQGDILGSLLGYVQVFGRGIKGWMSRRFVIIGGPLVSQSGQESPESITDFLLKKLKEQARGKAIFIEFRNLSDTGFLRSVFEKRKFRYMPHLNFLLKTDEETAVKQRMSSSRRRQIKISLAAGATIAEPEDEAAVITYYRLLEKLYAEKVKKPLVSQHFFTRFWRTGAGKIFLVKYQDEIKGGIVCPIFNHKYIYEWYICGLDGEIKNVYPSVLATWAPIVYGLENGLVYFDFLGAGKPGEEYGVREFKSRFGGEEVCFGRYEMILNRPLYAIGKLALQLYRKLPL